MSGNKAIKPNPVGSDAAKASGDQGKGRRYFRSFGQKKFTGATPELSNCVFDCQNAANAKTFYQTLEVFATYAGTKYALGGDISKSIKQLKEVVPVAPSDPGTNPTRTELKIWEVEVTEFIKLRNKLKATFQSMYSLVWGQCTEYTKTRLQQQPGYAAINAAQDSIRLLSMIRDLTFKLDSKQHPVLAMVDNDLRIFRYAQGKDMPDSQYHEQFKSLIQIIKKFNGLIGVHPRLVHLELREISTLIDPEDFTTYTQDQLDYAQEMAQQKC